MKHIRLVETALFLALLCASAVLAQDCDWTGTWDTDFGQMVLQQSSNTVTGTYTSDQGQIQGAASGNKLTGTWSEAPSRTPPGDAGDIEFTISDDCNSFSGNWRYDSSGDWSGSWSGTRISGPSATGLSTTGPSATADLTGVWDCDDGGTYYIRQLGSTIWWYGEPSNNPDQWSNVAKGTISGNTINLDWADVPKGTIMNSGILVLNIESNNRLTATQKTGGFEGSTWARQTAGTGMSSAPAQPVTTILDHAMASNVDESTNEVITRTNVFSTTDGKAYSWLSLGNVGAGTVEWRWYSPDGDLFSTGFVDIPAPAGAYWDSYYVWYYIDVAGDDAADLPGDWHVDVYLDDKELLTEQFTIAADAGTGTSPSGPSIGSSTASPGSSLTNPWQDPAVRQLVDEWIRQQDRCLKNVYGSGAYIDQWGRACGNLGSTQISCNTPPDHPADWDSYHYLWANNWCPIYYPYRVQAYVGYRQSGYSFDDLVTCKTQSESCST